MSDPKPAPAAETKKPHGVRNALVVFGIGIALLLLYLCYSLMPLDRIESYQVIVAPQRDGSLDITYRLRWKVLDSLREGPLEWVRIGMANGDFKVTSTGGNVYSVRDAPRQTPYASLNLDRDYRRGEVAEIVFTVNQKRMLCEDLENPDLCFYDFTPGWFDGIQVDAYRFVWAGDASIRAHNADRVENGSLIWEGSLRKGERRPMRLYYSLSAFEDPELTQWRPADPDGGNADGPRPDPRVYGVIFALTIVFSFSCLNVGGDRSGYRRGRGFYRGGSGGGCACACAGCACACACAGGGRAGCSAKDFYQGERRGDAKGAVEKE